MKKNDIKKLVGQLTLEEKAMLFSGRDGWSTVPIERLGIPSVKMSDGPHGLRVCVDITTKDRIAATCFPPAALLACSWDEELAKKQGQAIGEEAQDQGVQIVLGPGNNIKRSPLCGRNFEYFSEDPYLSGHIAAGVINGLQSKKVGTSLKHFCANVQETDRFSINEKISERALREIYLSSFEYPVKSAKPTTIMAAYNRINGIYCSQNKMLLTDILRKEWGYKGIVMSDWGAVDNRPQGVYAGLDLEMPTSYGLNEREIIKAAKGEKVALSSSDKRFKNTLTMQQIDRCVTRMLELIFSLDEKKNGKPCDYTKHHQIAADVAKESMVLLKNDGILPLKSGVKVAVIGEMAVRPRFQGGGSSCVNAMNLTKALDEIGKYSEAVYSQGYNLEDDADFTLINEAVKTAKDCDVAVVIAGLPDSYEIENYDRQNLSMPKSQLSLIDEVKKAQPNCVVVLCNGSAIEMPFADKVSAILETYLAGEAGAEAMADILFGKANPCGKLAETFPEMLSHTPSYLNFGGTDAEVKFTEGVFVGYRWYDTRKIKPRFPFGFGLSYTTFECSGMRLSSESINADDELRVAVTVKNTGTFDGKEVVQLYVHENASRVSRPQKELKGFKKVFIKAGESVEVSFTLDKRSFAYWDEKTHSWEVDSGKFTILCGNSSDNCPLKKEIDVKGRELVPVITPYSWYNTLLNHPNGHDLARKIALKFDIDIDKEEKNSANIKFLEEYTLKMLLMMFDIKMPLEELISDIEKVNGQI